MCGAVELIKIDKIIFFFIGGFLAHLIVSAWTAIEGYIRQWCLLYIHIFRDKHAGS